MAEQFNETGGVKGIIARVPPVLIRVVIVVTAVYFLGFLWTYTGGNLIRLIIPMQWEVFYVQREYAATIGGRWFLFGTSVAGLFTNWLVLLALITGAYYAYDFIRPKKP